ncbi:hypothetical protein Syun_027973 [Stephania yunnanensis]|uniref:Uncharacterized protein n=1 Tax=Stephania yunnanensis TaxID=152371 RepID=A0AAP0ELP8_9MAGN
MEGVMDTFDDEAFHVDPRMKTKAQVRTDQNSKEEDSRSAAQVQTYEVRLGCGRCLVYTHEKNDYSRQHYLFYSLSNEMNVFGGEGLLLSAKPRSRVDGRGDEDVRCVPARLSVVFVFFSPLCLVRLDRLLHLLVQYPHLRLVGRRFTSCERLDLCRSSSSKIEIPSSRRSARPCSYPSSINTRLSRCTKLR